jgi:hypothetical protein
MDERSALEAGRSKLGPRRCSLLLWIVRSRNVSFAWFLSEAHQGVADGPHTGEFFKKLLLSGLIYGISESRLGMVMVEIMHLRINQLGKLVSPLGCDGHQS